MTETVPKGGTPITTEELLKYIGQLYVQTQVMQRLLAEQSQQLVNGAVHDAIPT